MKRIISIFMICAVITCVFGFTTGYCDGIVEPDPNLLTYTAEDGDVYYYHDCGDTLELIFIYPKTEKSTFRVLSEIDGKPITKITCSTPQEILAINDYRNTSIEELIIPGSIEIVEPEECFFTMRNLKTVVLEEGVKEVRATGTILHGFNSSVENITLPDSLEVIGKGAFANTKIKEIIIPSNVKEIGREAFSNCAGITSVIIPSKCRSIGARAFLDCPGLYQVTLSEGVENIGENAFTRTSIEEIRFPKSMKTVGKNAFYRTPLKKAEMHDGIKLADSAMASDKLTEVVGLSEPEFLKNWKAFSGTPYAKSYEIKDKTNAFVIDNGVLEAYLGDETNVVIPDNVTKISEYAFRDAVAAITELTIPSSVKEIGESAFSGLKIKELLIPSSVYDIGNYAFSHCDRLETVTVEEGDRQVKLKIRNMAFANCDKLKKITVPTKNITIHDAAFANDTMVEQLRKSGVWEKNGAEVNDTPKPTASPAESTPAPTEEPQVSVLAVTGGETIEIAVDGKEVEFDAKPFIDENDRTQVPVRAVSEMLNADVDWDGETRTVTILRDTKTVNIIIGSDTITVDGKTVKMDTAAIIKDNRTYIPVRFVAEALGMTVEWME